ncbi:hypothetical protein ABPG75_001884 [Micractinium tetrahymenae]
MASPAPIHCLPDDLLGRIFGLVCWEDGGLFDDPAAEPLPLVCRRWRQAFFSAAAVWHTLALFPDVIEECGALGRLLVAEEAQGADWAAAHPGGQEQQQQQADQAAADEWLAGRTWLFGQVGGLVRSLTIASLSVPQPLDPWAEQTVLSALQHCSQLAELELAHWPGQAVPQAAVHALRSLTALTRLKLQGSWPSDMLSAAPRLLSLELLHFGTDSAIAGMLSQATLPQRLTELLCDHSGVRQQGAFATASFLSSVLPRLPGLVRLHVDLTGFLLPPAAAEGLAASLQQATALAELHLAADGLSPSLLGSLAALPALTSLRLYAQAGPLPVPLSRLEALSGLRSLAQLLRAAVPPGSSLSEVQATAAPSSSAGGAAVRFPLQGCAGLPALQQVHSMSLEGFAGITLDPAATPALALLSLHRCRCVAVPAGATFPALCSLRFDQQFSNEAQPSFSADELEGALSALLPAAPQLRTLHLFGCHEAAVPALCALSSHPAPRLAKLVLDQACQLQDMPAGSYLSSLRELQMPCCRLAALPVAVSAATSLHTLDVSCNWHLRITSADVAATLVPLHQLTRLSLDRWDPPMIGIEAAVRLFRALPLLELPSQWCGYE